MNNSHAQANGPPDLEGAWRQGAARALGAPSSIICFANDTFPL